MVSNYTTDLETLNEHLNKQIEKLKEELEEERNILNEERNALNEEKDKIKKEMKKFSEAFCVWKVPYGLPHDKIEIEVLVSNDTMTNTIEPYNEIAIKIKDALVKQKIDELNAEKKAKEEAEAQAEQEGTGLNGDDEDKY